MDTLQRALGEATGQSKEPAIRLEDGSCTAGRPPRWRTRSAADCCRARSRLSNGSRAERAGAGQDAGAGGRLRTLGDGLAEHRQELFTRVDADVVSTARERHRPRLGHHGAQPAA